jgi:hypothetical protein
MRKMNFKINLTITLIALTLFVVSCSSNDKTNGNSGAKTEKTDNAKKGKEYTSAYICPMYCEGSGSSEMGQCPVCGMDYVKNEN